MIQDMTEQNIPRKSGKSQIGRISGSLPGITVVIPAYNRERLICTTLQSLADQIRKPDLVILVDNNSTDDTKSVLERWGSKRNAEGWDVKVIGCDKKGASSARQAGLVEVNTESVLFFDSDDLMPRDHIANAMKEFEENPKLDMVVWGVRFSEPGGKSHCRRLLKKDHLQNHLIQGLLSTQAYAIKSDFIRKAGGWNGNIGGWDDLELGLRLLLANPEMKLIREPRVEIRVHQDSMTGFDYKHRAGEWETALDEMERNIEKSDHPRKIEMLRLIDYRRINLAALYRKEGDLMRSKSIRQKVLNRVGLRHRDKLILNCVYHYTSLGLPAAGGIFPPLLLH